MHLTWDRAFGFVYVFCSVEPRKYVVLGFGFGIQVLGSRFRIWVQVWGGLAEVKD